MTPGDPATCPPQVTADPAQPHVLPPSPRAPPGRTVQHSVLSCRKARRRWSAAQGFLEAMTFLRLLVAMEAVPVVFGEWRSQQECEATAASPSEEVGGDRAAEGDTGLGARRPDPDPPRPPTH